MNPSAQRSLEQRRWRRIHGTAIDLSRVACEDLYAEVLYRELCFSGLEPMLMYRRVVARGVHPQIAYVQISRFFTTPESRFDVVISRRSRAWAPFAWSRSPWHRPHAGGWS